MYMCVTDEILSRGALAIHRNINTFTSSSVLMYIFTHTYTCMRATLSSLPRLLQKAP